MDLEIKWATIDVIFYFILFFVSILFMFVCIHHLFFSSIFWVPLRLRSLSALLSNSVCKENNFHGFPISVHAIFMCPNNGMAVCLRFLTRAQMLMHVVAHGGCTSDTVRESALEVHTGRKIPCRTRDSNPHQYCTWLFSWLSTNWAIPGHDYISMYTFAVL